MHTFWWLALGVAVAVALVAALVDGRGRLVPRRTDGAAAAPEATPEAGPRPGELWWAQAPSPVLVLVLDVRHGRARVADVTEDGRAETAADGTAEPESGPASERGPEPAGGPLRLPRGVVTAAPDQAPRLDPGTARGLALTAFRHRAGALRPEAWARLRERLPD